jgi:hypothetical protein
VIENMARIHCVDSTRERVDYWGVYIEILGKEKRKENERRDLRNDGGREILSGI